MPKFKPISSKFPRPRRSGFHLPGKTSPTPRHGGCASAEFPELTRRGLLLRGGGLITGATVGAALGLGFSPAPALAFDWFGLAGKTMPDVSGKVRFLKGEAFANRRPLRLGARVPPAAFITVSGQGKLIIAVADGSVFTLYGGSQLKLLVGRMRQGLLKLLAGALLFVAPKRSRYLVGGPQASFGIKGTVVFHQIFAPEDQTARTMEGTIQLPDYAGSYFCTCNGAVEYLIQGRNDPYFSERADYHNSYFIHGTEKGRIVKAPMLNHADEDIRELISYQDGPKHDISWLRH